MCKTEEAAKRAWEPQGGSPIRSHFGRLLSFWTYPALLPFIFLSRCDSTVANAVWWRNAFLGLWGVLSAVAHTLPYRRWSGDPWCLQHLLAQACAVLMVDMGYAFFVYTSHLLVRVLGVDRNGNRLNAGRLRGPRVLVVGNGPSAVEGEPLGHKIDEFDEVVRFNNFQTKTAGMEKFVGTKTTAHFSDGVLYPTFKEYHVPGADVMLSLVMDRFMVAGSYFIMRGGADLQPRLAREFLCDPSVGWISKDSIERLKKVLGLRGVKHPTSGMLAIDHFVNQPGVQLPVYIHGFDFFQGPKVHYFDDCEPLYERVNDRIGVNMHSPEKEKVYVEQLIAEGKVCFLKNL